MTKGRFAAQMLLWFALIYSPACSETAPQPGSMNQLPNNMGGDGDGDGDVIGDGDGDGDVVGDGDGDVIGDGDGDGDVIGDGDGDGDGDGTCCPSGDCVCRGPAPTADTINGKGPFVVEKYTDGFRDGDKFGGATIYYPTDAEPPLSAVVMCPGWTALQSSIQDWGPFFASHGIVLMTIDTNNTADVVAQRAEALMDALESLKAENTREGSPLKGKLTADRFGLSGWSMGGGGTWMATAKNPELKTAVTLAGHHATAGGASIAAGSQVPTLMLAGETDSAILGGGGQSQAAYMQIPETTPKILYEMAGEGHFAWGTPVTKMNASGRYMMAFQKVFLEGDERYRQFLLVEGPGASDWMSNVK